MPTVKPAKKTSLIIKTIRTSMLLFVILGLCASGLAVSWLNEVRIFDITKSDLKPIIQYKTSDNTLIFDRNGSKIGELFNKYHIKSSYKEIPIFLVRAIVAIEDGNFFLHDGIDQKAIMRAAWDRIKYGRIRQGASTITQQLVRHFLLTKEKSLDRKVREAALAIELEKHMSKEDIFTRYANVMYLGSRSYGVGAAAQRYFSKPLNELKNSELAVIAGLFQSPSRYNPHRHPKRAKKRQLQVLAAMYRSGYITKKELTNLRNEKIEYKKYQQLNQASAPYFIDYIQEKSREILGKSVHNQGVRIYTTLDQGLQKMAIATFKERKDIIDKAKNLVLIPLHKKNKNPAIQSAFLSTDPKTGEILTMVGGLDYNKSNFNRTVQAKRQPGSSFKPVIYSLALSKGHKWSDLMFVSPIKIKNYRPKNFGRQFLTETTLLRAFFKSINTPAVELGAELGLSRVLKHARAMGVETPLKIEAGSLLGSSDVTMMDMARIYGTIANEGVKVDLVAITKITDTKGNTLYKAPTIKERSTKVLSKQDAFLMLQGLKSVFTAGTAFSESDLGSFAAGKTGTSNNSRDNWFCGFTSDLVTINWIGSDRSFDFMGKATGTSLALPLWSTFVRKSLKVRPANTFTRPKGIIHEKVDSTYGHKSSRGFRMYFKKGQGPIKNTSDLKILSERGGYRSIFDN